jgi:hypothetical protein
MRQLAESATTNLSRTVYIGACVFFASCGKLPDYQVLNSTYAYTAAGELNPNVDILFVVDNSGSMSGNQTTLSNSMSDFIDSFSSKNLKFHIGVTSTDQYCNPEIHSPTNLPSNSACSSYWSGSAYNGFYNDKFSSLLSQYSGERFLTWLSANYVSKFEDNVILGTGGSGFEMPILSATNALKDPKLTGWNNGFVRSDSFLAVIMVTDEDETTEHNSASKLYNSTNLTPMNNRIDGFTNAVAALRPNLDRFRVDVVARRPSDGTCSADIAYGMNYMVNRINSQYPAVAPDPAKAKISTICSNFAGALSDIGDAIVQSVAKVSLNQLPANANEIYVRVNGVTVPRSTTNGWEYYANENYIQFFGTAIPSAGDEILVDYTPANPI